MQKKKKGADVHYPRQSNFYDTRQRKFADIGLRAMYINRRLRTLCNYASLQSGRYRMVCQADT